MRPATASSSAPSSRRGSRDANVDAQGGRRRRPVRPADARRDDLQMVAVAGVLRRGRLEGHAGPRRRRGADEPGDPQRRSAAVDDGRRRRTSPASPRRSPTSGSRSRTRPSPVCGSRTAPSASSRRRRASTPGYPKTIAVHGDRGTAVIEQEDVLRWDFAPETPEDARGQGAVRAEGRGVAAGRADPKAISPRGAPPASSPTSSGRSGRTRAPQVDGREGRKAVALICAIYEVRCGPAGSSPCRRWPRSPATGSPTSPSTSRSASSSASSRRCRCGSRSASAGRLAWLAYRVDRRHREVARDNLRHAFPERCADPAECDRLVRAMLPALLHDGSSRSPVMPRRMHVHNWRSLGRPRSTSSGSCALLLPTGRCCSVTAHFGNWEVAGYVTGLIGFKTYAIARDAGQPAPGPVPARVPAEDRPDDPRQEGRLRPDHGRPGRRAGRRRRSATRTPARGAVRGLLRPAGVDAQGGRPAGPGVRRR